MTDIQNENSNMMSLTGSTTFAGTVPGATALEVLVNYFQRRRTAEGEARAQ